MSYRFIPYRIALPLAGALAFWSASATATPFDGQHRLLDAGTATLTLQPGALGFIEGGELSLGLISQLDPSAPRQSWDLRVAGGADGFAGGLLLRQDDREQWWTGYGLGFAVSGLSLGLSAQARGVPLWATAAERSERRVDAGVTLRPTGWAALAYGVGREVAGDGTTGAEQRLGAALRTQDGGWGLEGGLCFDDGGDVKSTELGLAGRFGALGLRLRGEMDTKEAVTAGLFVSYAFEGATVGLGATGDAESASIAERFSLRSRTTPGADAGSPELLAVRLSGPLEQRAIGGLFAPTGRPFADLLEDVRRAATDPRVSGVYLELDSCTGGLAQAGELRAALEEVRSAGKQVVAYLESSTLIDLYLAGSADWVAASPTLQLLKTGVGGTSYYLADLLAQAGIQAQFVRTGPHKSGPETYLMNGPSDEAREQFEAYLKAVEAELVRGIGQDDPARIDQWRKLALEAPVTADGLMAIGLVQAVGYNDQVEEAYKAAFSKRLTKRDAAPWREEEGPWAPPAAIGVLHIEGEIVDAAGGLDLLGGDPVATTRAIVEAADTLREDDAIAGAIVLVDSPGGSAWASDEMAHALKRLAAKKPVVVSMGSVAASGGYYVASLGVPIFAMPTTLTGSIGVYAGTFSVDGLFGRLGVHPVRFERGGPTDLLGPHTWSDGERAAIERSVEATYARFLALVAESRGMSVERAREIAGGRIYTGEAAKALGLVDELTGFEGARRYLLDQLGLDEATTLVHLPSGAGELTLSAGLALLSGAPETNGGAAMLQVVDALGLRRLAKTVRPMVSGAEGAPMMHFDGFAPVP